MNGVSFVSNDLGVKQQLILDFLKQEILSKGYPPSVREIGEAVGLKSTSTVHGHLERLEKKGIIRRDPTKPRAIEILDDEFNVQRREIVNVPILGRVAAGEPLLAVENIEEYFPLPVDYAPNQELFMLRVKGDSMINVGIFEGDLIIVQKQSTATNGDIVVALLEDSVTVKTYYRESDHIRLQPENDQLEPIRVYDDSIVIEGKVISLFRQYI
ncbi:transcriptional repressor of the SOS regulon [Petrocella atlantisensis]|jgi:repressor LexA|uniref:LexA repressor n=1 Tax=Petrocella atlantisensis TaxID=2173034 RepID=A0A3P7NSX7_9FIRM|nr:transcriptional repressor LexA [Vallitaleaceae bacterium]PKM53023.1 MAG: transcriptional repressor LexA [Firmicutes bacterium HGW-Firmicutes-5]VDN46005.1 transcriptional repressor of the SOS regulon [Petrocella atlantisensis]